MKRGQYTDEQIIGFLKQAEAGMPVKDLCRKEGFSDVRFYKWRAEFGGMDTSRLKTGGKCLPMCPVRSVTYVSGRSAVNRRA